MILQMIFIKNQGLHLLSFDFFGMLKITIYFSILKIQMDFYRIFLFLKKNNEKNYISHNFSFFQ
ncbi:hypothetical protein BZL53_13370 [Flavobacterium columnare]|nr:hypothetical protein BZL53_13370 [Flavobacterium columnare]